ncbi:MAG: [Fe-Fe] hydrogenase large subunit C-terminal domain-containing protein [Clostridia bacterium]|nr:[Fe-Fe] hydrogenase large subunit C-terminal domain-containing protein [Clostridia bacterium]
MGEYFHSVTLNKDKCKGCTNCIKRCPTEAIRVRDGKARIINERCIDCGECIRICPYHAKQAITDPLNIIEKYKYSIALPAPTLYGQFKNFYDVQAILNGLLQLGFNEVYEVARGADIISSYINRKIKQKKYKKPIISSACPAILRLIQVRFPELIQNVIDVDSPMETAAKMAKKEAIKKFALSENDIGAFFITPCAAKMTSIKNPIGNKKSYVDGAISIQDIYGPLNNVISNYKSTGHNKSDRGIQKASGYGVGWAISGGEGHAVETENFLSVDGIQNVIKVLEEIENNKLNDLDFFEGLACPGGCVGGPLTVENGFVAKNRVRRLAEKVPKELLEDRELDRILKTINVDLKEPITAKSVMKLDEDIVEAIKKMERLEQICDSLPGLDCGSCGAPSCRTLAEDIVRGNASEFDCIFKLREKVKELATQMVDISDKFPPRKG